MREYRNSIFYSIVVLTLGALMYWIGIKGKYLESNIESNNFHSSYWVQFMDTLGHNFQHPLAILIFQIITIVLVARVFGWLFKKIGQPSVIGEIIAGIALGPSLLGMYFPELSNVIFPVESLGNLQFLSQIGLILFMFVIGMELDLNVLKSKVNDAVVISHASIIFPFTLGMGLAYVLYSQLAPPGINFLSFALFMGIAMSITAFPVLARIVQERGIHKTKLGTIVITAAATDDITAWCLLASVIAIVKAGSFVSSLYIIGLAILYVLMMITLVKPFFQRIGDLSMQKGMLSKTYVAIFLLTLLISSYCTEVIGIHALFGAFMTGAIMPMDEKFRSLFIEKVEDIALILFLPLFFVYTGLRTEIGLINDIYLWKVTISIIIVAVVGKFVGSAIAARFVGQSWKDSLMIGALMNTRGLMELVVLNIGLDLGVLTPEMFAMMVVMALVTTFMTGPSLNFIQYLFRKKVDSEDSFKHQTNQYRILFSFAHPIQGINLLKLSHLFSSKQIQSSELTGMLIGMSDDVSTLEKSFEMENLYPVIDQAKKLNRKISTLFKISYHIEDDIIDVANSQQYDLLLLGANKSIYHGTVLGKLLGFTQRLFNPDVIIDSFKGKDSVADTIPFDDFTRHILTNVKIPVGVFVDKGLEDVSNVLVVIDQVEDIYMMDYLQKLLHHHHCQGTILDLSSQVKQQFLLNELYQSLQSKYPGRLQIVTPDTLSPDTLFQHDLVLISIFTWKTLLDSHKDWTSNFPSTLIIQL